MMKGAITITNLHVPNVGAPNFIKQILLDLKRETGSNTIVEISVHHYDLHRSVKKISKETRINYRSNGSNIYISFIPQLQNTRFMST
jgi:hypothetical protein